MSAGSGQFRSSFVFFVNGTERHGSLYVTLSYVDEAKAAAKARNIAIKRSGDSSPEYRGAMAPVR